MHTIRVDGNDIFAVYSATQKAREFIVKEKRPVLLESISYRVGDHSTSDFSQRYRDEEEMKKWNDLLGKFGNPIDRFEKYLLRRKLITEDRPKKLREEALQSVRQALKNATGELLPEPDVLFTQVYDEMPDNLIEQREELREHLKKWPNDYDLEKFKNGKQY
jgi:2-oxoisovalerate dehydrogenase E1 component alpha subunit